MRPSLSGQRNQCAGCSKLFNSNVAFDKHRTGVHGSSRRCMTEDEMMEIGMLIGSSGYWITCKSGRSFNEDSNANEGAEAL